MLQLLFTPVSALLRSAGLNGTVYLVSTMLAVCALMVLSSASQVYLPVPLLCTLYLCAGLLFALRHDISQLQSIFNQQNPQQLDHQQLLIKTTTLGTLTGRLQSLFTDVERAQQSHADRIEEIAFSAQELRESADLLAANTEQQSAATAAGAAAIVEMTQGVENVAGLVREAAGLASRANQYAIQGSQQVKAATESIHNIDMAASSSAELIQGLNEQSRNIHEITDLIRSISEQTNLLALNAAIEAARAGEHGRGFAVVADEVRGLAVRTHKATEEIQQVISELSKASGAAVHSMQGSVDMARQGVDATTESGEVLRKILENVQQISELNEQIAAATYEQSTTFSEVTGHMGDMHRNAEAVMESTDELDTVSRKIQDVSNGLQSVAGQFRV